MSTLLVQPPGYMRPGARFLGGAVQVHELYKKYRQLIEELANKRHSRDCALTDLYALLQRFASEASVLEAGGANLLCEQLADQLEQEARPATGKHRRNVLQGAVKGFDAMSFPNAGAVTNRPMPSTLGRRRLPTTR